jgi:hypothetical protein
MVRRSDMFLTGFLPGHRQKFGIDVDDIREVNPNIIYAVPGVLSRHNFTRAVDQHLRKAMPTAISTCSRRRTLTTACTV